MDSWGELGLLSELPANATHYEFTRAMPDLISRKIIWGWWGMASLLAAGASSSIMAGVTASPKARSSAFNIYLVALAVPDFVGSFFCAFTCWINFSYEVYTGGDLMCAWQTGATTFGIAGSFWMNALVAREIHTLLRKTHAMRLYTPPTHRMVVLKSSAVLCMAALFSSLHLWGLPFKHFPIHGLACVASYYDHTSSLFVYFAVLPLVAGIPTCYICFIAFDCWRRKLLRLETTNRIQQATKGSQRMRGTSEPYSQQRLVQRRRQARELTLYYSRIFVAVLVIWVPATICLLFIRLPHVWGMFSGGLLAHLQGFVSALVCLTKADVREAVIQLYTCGSLNSEARRSVVVPVPGCNTMDLRGSHCFHDAGRRAETRLDSNNSQNSDDSDDVQGAHSQDERFQAATAHVVVSVDDDASQVGATAT
eukprot:scaffold9443_cov29-Tisochrysis_lutea.AAC.1